MRRLLHTFVAAVDLLCCPHTICHVGERFEFSELDEFMTNWIKLLYSNASAKQIWAALISSPVAGWNNVRWYCKAEIVMQIGMSFSWIRPFLEKLKELGIADTLRENLKRMYTNHGPTLKLQMAAILSTS